MELMVALLLLLLPLSLLLVLLALALLVLLVVALSVVLLVLLFMLGIVIVLVVLCAAAVVVADVAVVVVVGVMVVAVAVAAVAVGVPGVVVVVVVVAVVVVVVVVVVRKGVGLNPTAVKWPAASTRDAGQLQNPLTLAVDCRCCVFSAPSALLACVCVWREGGAGCCCCCRCVRPVGLYGRIVLLRLAPPWPNGLGDGLLIQRPWARVPQRVFGRHAPQVYNLPKLTDRHAE